MARLKLLLVVCMLLWCELIVVNYLEVHEHLEEHVSEPYPLCMNQ